MRPQLKNLEYETIVITGASSVIGLATARLAADRGAQVVLAARSADGLSQAADAIQGLALVTALRRDWRGAGSRVHRRGGCGHNARRPLRP
jgi:NADP-dependent 3-hydroxy acid dehydrogenase YdfG